jgi:hypothetical protein
MKLNLTQNPVEKPVVGFRRAKYSSPLGWWSVSTEGDCEGRTTTQLGTFYGHVAEIAFSLADKVCYSLKFKEWRDDVAGPKERPKYNATKKSVWISLESDSNTCGMDSESRAIWMEKWMNITDPKVYVRDTDAGGARYYAAVFLSLDNNGEKEEAIRLQRARNTALNKLTPAEKKLLGLT